MQFSVATSNLSDPKNRAEIAQKWSAAPGLAPTALHIISAEKIDRSDLRATSNRREQLSAVLSIDPLSFTDWLLLADMQLVTDQPMDQVSDSLEMSMLTGANEGYFMAERGIFAVSIWEFLSADLKKRAAADLAAGGEEEKLRSVLSTTSQGVRDELRAILLGAGLSSKEVDQRLRF